MGAQFLSRQIGGKAVVYVNYHLLNWHFRNHQRVLPSGNNWIDKVHNVLRRGIVLRKRKRGETLDRIGGRIYSGKQILGTQR